MNAAPDPQNPSRKSLSRLASPALAAAGLVVLASLLRLLVSLDDFWLDEIWSWTFAREARSPFDVFGIHHDNNHKLVTFWMSLVGDADHWFVFRLPSLLTGIGTVAVTGLWGRRRGRVDALLAVLLTATSFLLIQYSSEARGYAPVVFFAFLGWWCLQRYADRSGPAWLGFVACAGLGLLAHLTFVHFYLGALVWSCARFLRRGSHRAFLPLARLHAVPLGFLALLYWADIRHMVIGGGEPYSLPAVLLGTLSLAVGGPERGGGAVLGAVVALAVFVAGMAFLRREGSDEWLFFGTVILLSPALVLLATRPEVLFPRYFLISAAFLLLLAAFVLARVWEGGGAARGAAVALLVLVTCGNLSQVVQLASLGRGGYLRAVRMMAENTPGPAITVGSDHDLRNGMVLLFYRRYLPEDKRLEYVPQAELSTRPPEWFLVHRFHGASPAPAAVQPVAGQPYGKVRSFPYAGLSGWTWELYRRRPDRPGSFRPEVGQDPGRSRGSFPLPEGFNPVFTSVSSSLRDQASLARTHKLGSRERALLEAPGGTGVVCVP